MSITRKIADLPTNSSGERQIEVHHMDDNFAALETAVSTGFSAIFASGGTSVPGLVTLQGGSTATPSVRVQGRVGLTLDGTTAVSIVDQTASLSTLAAGKGLLVITADPVTVTRVYTDVVTGQSLTDTMNVRAGQLVMIGAAGSGVTLDGNGYPLPPANTLPVARLTRTSGGATLDGTVDTVPTLRALSGGGVSAADLNATYTAILTLFNAALADDQTQLDSHAARLTALESGQLNLEAIDDEVARLLGSSGTYDDAANTYTITVPAGTSQEQVEDWIANLVQVSGGGITKTYDDAGNLLTLTVTPASAPVTSVAGRTGAVTLAVADVSGAAAQSDLTALASRVTTLEGGQLSLEAIEDDIARMLGTVGTYNDAANTYTITLPAARTDEEIQDVVAALLQVSGSSISKTYDDAGNVLTLTVTGGSGSRTLSGTTASAANAASVNLDLSNATPAILRKLATNVPTRVGLYASSADRAADQTRLDFSPTTAPSGVYPITQATTATGLLTLAINEAVQGALFARLVNVSGGASALTLTLTLEDV